MINQKWLVKIDDREIEVEYSCSPMLGRTVLCVDGDPFVVKGKPFGIGLERREAIILGSEQAFLDIKKNGHATLICREGEVSVI